VDPEEHAGALAAARRCWVGAVRRKAHPCPVDGGWSRDRARSSRIYGGPVATSEDVRRQLQTS